jgi:hypothetical protein
MLKVSSGFFCNSAWQNLLTSRRQAARSCSFPCPIGCAINCWAQAIPNTKAQTAFGTIAPFRIAISVVSSRDHPRLLNSQAACAVPDPGRFPPLCSVEEQARFVVTDSAGQALAYVYFEDEPTRQI